MEKELQELKSVLRSLVVSSPAQVDVRSLQRDYRTMMGAPIPVHKYAYRDVLAFLKERCGDCFLFHGLPSNPTLTLIVPDSLKHIDQFVQRQKSTAVTKMKGKRRSVVETISKPLENSRYEKQSNRICETFNENYVSKTKLNNNDQEKKPALKSQTLHTDNNITTNNVYNGAKEASHSVQSNNMPEIVHTHSQTHIQQKPEQNGYNSSENVRNFLKKRLPIYNSSMYLDSEEAKEPDKVSSKEDNDSGRQTSSSQSSTKKAQLEQLKSEIHDLIQQHENGVLLTDIMRLYRERYGRELNLHRVGHYNITSLLCAMDERVAFAGGAGGVRAVDARARAPAPRPRAPPRARAAPAAAPVDPDDALPGIDFDPDVFPADCMHFMESIPAASLRDVRPGAMLEVAVGEVYSPSHFWVQRLGPRHTAAMHALMDDMTSYYGAGEGRARVLARGAVRPGHYCASLFERDWHRALIVKIIDADTVKVRHVDYGTVDSVPASELKPLRREYAALPTQAVRARLAGLRPGAGGRRWPHAAAAHFLHLVRDKHFIANVVALHEEEDTIETFLIDTGGADDVCVTAEMIRAGHADARADSALATGECYLFPRFEALESGDTPNYAEIHRYLADGIALEFVDSYRRHVPAALPAPAAPPHAPAPPPAPSPPPPPLDRLRLRSPAPRSPPRDPTPPSPLARSTPLANSSGFPGRGSLTPGGEASPAQTGSDPLAPSPHLEPLATSASSLCATAAPFCPPFPISSGPAPVQHPAHEERGGARAPQPAPPPLPGPPQPPGGAMPPWGSVQLSLQECDMYTLLSSLDPEAAHCYMLSALRRAAAAHHVLPPHAFPPAPPSYRFPPVPPPHMFPPALPPHMFPPAAPPHMFPGVPPRFGPPPGY